MLFGALKPVNDVLGGIRLQTSVWGKIVPIVRGRNRISGNLIRYDDFIAQSVSNRKKGASSGGSGKKGSGQYDYGAAVAIALCRGPMAGIGSIWPSQGLLPSNNTQESYTVASGGGSYTVTQVNTFQSDLGCSRADSYSVAANDFGAPGPITITGTTQTPMQPTADSNPSTIPAGFYFESGGVYTFGAADAGKLIAINYSYAPPITAGGFSQDPIVSLGFTFFNGAMGQAPWGYDVTNHPSKALGYSLLAYLATQLMDLGTAGILPNNSYEALGIVAPGHGNGQGDELPGDTLLFLLTDPIDGAGILSTEVGDLTAYHNYCGATGLYVSPVYDQQGTLADHVNALLEATNAELVESDWLLKIIPRGDTTNVGNGFTFVPNTQPVYNLTMDDLIRKGVRPAVEGSVRDVREAFNYLTASFCDRANSYNTLPITAQDLDAIQKYKMRVDSRDWTKLFAYAAPAIAAAQTVLARSTYILRKFNITTSQKYILLEPMDIVTIPLPPKGTTQGPVRVLAITEQPNGDLEMECEDFPWGTSGPTIYPKQAGTSNGPNANVAPGPINPPIIFEALSRQNNQVGHALYMGLSGGPNWGGCRVHASVDGGASYSPVGTWTSKAKMGTLAAILPSAADPDTANTLAVDLTESNGSLTSFSAADTDAFVSLCWVDGEIVGYETATLIGANKYNLATRLRRGVFNSPIGSHAVGSKFLFLDDSVFGWLYDPTLIGKTLYFKFTSLNTSGLMEESIANVAAYSFTPTGAQLGLLMPAHATYAPATNPLTAIDAGSSATIDIAAFLMRVPGVPDIAENSGAITGLSYKTLYYVYFDDPGFAGGAVTYVANVNKGVALEGAGRFFVGSITTPAAGAPPTTGNGDGGAGAQTGLVYRLAMSSTTTGGGAGTTVNPSNAIDGDSTTFAAISLPGGPPSTSKGQTLILFGAPGFNARYSSLKLFVRLAVPTANYTYSGASLGPQPVISWSYNGGYATTLMSIDGGAGPVPIQTYSFALPQGLNLALVQVQVGVSFPSNTTGGTFEVDCYEVWMEASS